MYETTYSEIMEFKLSRDYKADLNKFIDLYISKISDSPVVIILGNTGTGKSILAKMLAKKLSYAYHDGFEDTICIKKDNVIIDPIWQNLSLLHNLCGCKKVIFIAQCKDDFIHTIYWKQFLRHLKIGKHRNCVLIKMKKENLLFQKGLEFFNQLER